MGGRAGGSALRRLRDALAGPDVTAAARALLGCEVRGADGVVIRLTEVEAYAGVGADPASHAHRGPTARNRVMFGEPGTAYVYFVFGMHWCLNVVCGQVGEASAVLVRAGEVIAGTALARLRRGAAVADRDLARGPGRLAVALGVDARVNGTSLVDGTGPVTLIPAAESGPGRVPGESGRVPGESGRVPGESGRAAGGARPGRAAGQAGAGPAGVVIDSGPRVGVAAGAEVPWRFWLRGEPTVSAYRRHVPRRSLPRDAGRPS